MDLQEEQNRGVQEKKKRRRRRRKTKKALKGIPEAVYMKEAFR